MSPQPPSLDGSDLQKLREEGYALHVRADHLLVSVPYATAERKVTWGFLVSSVETSGAETTAPDIHVVYFLGQTVDDYPCDSDGNRLTALIHHNGPVDLGSGLVVTCGFSQRPRTGRNDFEDYFDKMSTYVGMLQAEAQSIDSTVTYREFPPIATEETESVFRYLDSATTRARIGAVVDNVRGQKIAIIGLGGTGSYILDTVTKTPVAEIHLFDADVLLTHNAFRAPGAATIEQLTARPLKVEHHQATYNAMHRHVIAHPEAMTTANTQELTGFDFVFVSMDASPDKLAIFQALQTAGIPFVDTGMGIYQHQTSIAGVLRTSLSAPNQPNPAWLNAEVQMADDGGDDYNQNIQIAELNMMNAALAVIMWKKHFGFYADLEHEHSSAYTIDGNHLLNETPE